MKNNKIHIILLAIALVLSCKNDTQKAKQKSASSQKDSVLKTSNWNQYQRRHQNKSMAAPTNNKPM